MDMALLQNILTNSPETIVFLAVLLTLTIFFFIKSLALKQKVYFANRTKECYNQILYATQDGYFSFLYPDYNVKDPREKIKEICSRRLAVLLNLKEGTKSSFEDVLTLFNAQDAKDLKKLLNSLKEDGLSFEKEYTLKKGMKILIFGTKISDIDGNVFCDILWFRDVSFSNAKKAFLETTLKQINEKNTLLEKLFNTTPYPLWIRDEKLNIIYKNNEYQKICKEAEDILSLTQDASIQNLPLKASNAKKSKNAISSIILDGKKEFFDFIETPIINDLASDEIKTCGLAINATELNEIKRKLKENQSKQLEVFSALDTAFAVFDEKQKLRFYNDAFINLFKLEKIWASSKPSYAQFLDIIREKRIIQETSIYQTYKKDELLAFEKISTSQEDTLFLTDEKTLKRIRAPYSQGGLIFAFEDISSQISQQSQYASLLNMQQDILNNIFDGVIIFAPNGTLSFYNDAFVSMWKQKDQFLQSNPTISELIDEQQSFFNKVDDWQAFKKEFLEHIFNPSTKVFSINTDKSTIYISSKTLFDGSIIITYRQ